MANVLIEENSLVAIGDALRRKHGETKPGTVIVYEPIVMINKSPGATGAYNPAAMKIQGEIERRINFDRYEITTIPGAAKIEVILGWECNFNDDAKYGWSISVASGAYSSASNFPSSATKLDFLSTGSGGGKRTYTYDGTDTITIRHYHNVSSWGEGNTFELSGYYAEVRGYDAEGNILFGEQEVEGDVPNTYLVSEMAGAVDNIIPYTEPIINEITITANGTYTAPAGVDGYNPVVVDIEIPTGDLPEEALNITGNCQYRFANGGWDWFINLYGNKITTSDITSGSNMFYYAAGIEAIPFEINFNKGSSYHTLNNMFCNDSKLKEIPKINNVIPSDMDHFFTGCNNIRYLPEDIGDWFDWSYMEKQTSGYTGSKSYTFQYCNSLRKVPMSLLKRANPNIVNSYSYFYGGFYGCYSLDELIGLPIPYTSTWTSSAFYNTFKECCRLKDMTFAVQEDGTPYSVNWKSQTIDLSEAGFASIYKSKILNYNSGITADKEVKDDTTYQALKDDPDWFASNVAYSRYNHDSAVNTINSLPIITATGTNTIKFKGASGSLTDGGAINTLTEEEIAVAAAKGWTVSLA